MADFKNYDNPWSAESTPWYGDENNRWLDYNAGGDILHAPPSLPERPSWAKMLASYPGPLMKTYDMYQNIGGFLGRIKEEDLASSGYINSCAFRMSYGLIEAGYTLPKKHNTAKKELVLPGDNGKYYWGRVMELYAVMKDKLLGPPDITHSLNKAKLGEAKVPLTDEQMDDFNTRKGIVMFLVSGWGDASGHFTLWNGSNLNYPGNPDHDNPSSELYYFNMKYEAETSPGKFKVVQTDKVMLWEFK